MGNSLITNHCKILQIHLYQFPKTVFTNYYTITDHCIKEKCEKLRTNKYEEHKNKTEQALRSLVKTHWLGKKTDVPVEILWDPLLIDINNFLSWLARVWAKEAMLQQKIAIDLYRKMKLFVCVFRFYLFVSLFLWFKHNNTSTHQYVK